MEARHKKTVAVNAKDALAKAIESFLLKLLGLYMIRCLRYNIAPCGCPAKDVSVNLHIYQFFSNPNWRLFEQPQTSPLFPADQ